MLSRWRRSLRVHRSHCFVQPRDRQRRCERCACDRSRRPGCCAPPSCGRWQRASPPVMLGAGPDPCSIAARSMHSPREISSSGKPHHVHRAALLASTPSLSIASLFHLCVISPLYTSNRFPFQRRQPLAHVESPRHLRTPPPAVPHPPRLLHPAAAIPLLPLMISRSECWCPLKPPPISTSCPRSCAFTYCGVFLYACFPPAPHAPTLSVRIKEVAV